MDSRAVGWVQCQGYAGAGSWWFRVLLLRRGGRRRRGARLRSVGGLGWSLGRGTLPWWRGVGSQKMSPARVTPAVRFPEAARPITPSPRPLARPARRRSPHYRLSVSEMSGSSWRKGRWVWLQTAPGIVPVGPSGFRSPSGLGLAVQTRAARPPQSQAAGRARRSSSRSRGTQLVRARTKSDSRRRAATPTSSS